MAENSSDVEQALAILALAESRVGRRMDLASTMDALGVFGFGSVDGGCGVVIG